MLLLFAAEFRIIGRKPAPAVRALASLPGVNLVGQVPDVRPFVASSSVVVVPLRLARGVQNKVLEAMAMAKKIAAFPPMGVIQAKRAMNQSMETALSQGLRFDDEAWIACMHSDAWKEKLGEFARKERKS
mgnify:CR=1 FL=1